MPSEPLLTAPDLRRAGIWPGLFIAIGVAGIASQATRLTGIDSLGWSASPVLVAILAGLIIRNTLGIPEWCEAGIQFTLGSVLKFGIALMGIRLSLGTVADIGLQSLPLVIGCISTALIAVYCLSRWLQLSRTLATLIGVGTSICGCTAIMSVAPAIGARKSEICYAVTCVALFGTAGMLVYPYLAQGLFADRPMAAGMFLGTAIHDTSQVVGAGLLYEQNFGSPAGLEAATVTKFVRNLSMLIVIPLLTFVFARQRKGPGEKIKWHKLVPLFIVGFLAMSLVRTAGDLGDTAFGWIPRQDWQLGVAFLTDVSSALLTVAMAAVGLSTSLAGIRELGYRPALMGFVAAALVGAVSILLLSLS